MIRRLLIGAALALSLASCAAPAPVVDPEPRPGTIYNLTRDAVLGAKLRECGININAVDPAASHLIEGLVRGTISTTEFLRSWARIHPDYLMEAWCVSDKLAPGV